MTEENKIHGESHHKEHKKSDKITMSKTTLWKSISGILGILLVLSIFTGGFGVGKSGLAVLNAAAPSAVDAQPAQPRGNQPSQPSAPSVDMKALIDDDTVKGDPNAPITIVEWSDFECPFCTRFYQNTLGQIQREYIDTGKVKFVYRDFPLNFHKNAQKSAEAAECADEQGKFWEMHDILFEKGVSGGVDSFKQFATDIGLDTSKFNDCLDSGKMADEVLQDMQDGQAAGIRGTPGFVINGKGVSGAQPFENFKQIIEAELAK